MTEQCNRCRFWLFAQIGVSGFEEDEPYGWGWCRRNPPQLSERLSDMLIPSLGNREDNYDPDDVATAHNVADCSLFPAMWHDKWCGRFEPIATSLLPLVVERKALTERLEASGIDASEEDVAAQRLNELDAAIIHSPAASKDDVFAKLLLGVQLNAEGSYLPVSTAAEIVRDAQRFAGMDRATPSISRQPEHAK